ncbi:MAG: hypothetical protein KDD50_05985 [Bdellovibrionales bacterium]|nr:hypothetical protein [Bdellovibrionales bacterium]
MRGYLLFWSLCWLLFNPSLWAQTLTPEANFQITIDNQELDLSFGQYAETEAILEGDYREPITWNYDSAQIPQGLNIEDSSSESLLIYGTPQFTGRWCFILTAQDAFQNTASEQVCYHSKDDESAYYPKYKTTEPIFVASENEYFHESIGIDREELIEGGIVSGETPPGITYEFNRRTEEIEISGTPWSAGTYEFIAKIGYRGDESGYSDNYRQFRIIVSPEDVSDDDRTTCPSDYYYDHEKGYCVPYGQNCIGDTYYDSELNRCLPYPAPPRGTYCGPNQYYDQFLNRCVVRGYPRCPINSRWDNYYDRCLPTGYYCGIGERYSYVLRMCVPVWRDRSCRIGTHYDYARDRCVPNRTRCGRDEFWNGRRCERNTPACGVGRYWDPRRQRCVWRDDNQRLCRDGSVWNPREQRCVRRDRPRQCGIGSHWDPRRQRCVPDVRPRPMPEPPRPMPRPEPPRPMPRPEPPRPMPMPEPPRPMPRPEPPRPMPMPEPPRPMPMPELPRPMPRPEPPRPMPRPEPRPMPGPRPEPPRPPRPMPRLTDSLPESTLDNLQFLQPTLNSFDE